ncbi:cell division ATP-binding protein FtsE [Clostridium sp. CM028]|uniref:cell division ATP-binding protein FtsE n=1 Tax=Clostridium TaxID=1485 RepID=UPI0013EE6C20|nr:MULTISPECIES: cell division ATP-binding protein FtsE [Clostridium]MBU3091710.1 cell division ATP-binding protein FtsE [Clostridium sp. CF011]MBW9144789.1 cell division ATP-binding protein FtsE [Clostridium sp. CM027]MBW9149259.1 cell division ATP-binding protein FtsE [Clostridium sp. CM028]MBZ9609259.1 cell division ATP-binding protein FtsE [Clostridium estertheticum]UVE40464.1 cell division ATP-binding protein FtsE [Clostridium sp. CM027]
MIQFKKVTKIYDNNVTALSNIDITIKKGEFIFIVGPSGAGKSTFVKILLKEVEPTTGSVIINDTDITKLPRKKVPYHRRKIGVVFQDFRLIESLNIYENVAFALRATECSAKDIKKKVPYVLDLVGLSKKYMAFPHEISGGERQRVSLARAIVNNPTLLIADEPTGNLDPETALGIMDILKDINKSGTTVVMATHAKNIVDSMKKRVIAIEKGVIVRDEQRGRYGYED